MPEDMMPANLPEDKKGQWRKHYSEAVEGGMDPEKAAKSATEKCMKQNRSNGMNLSLSGLIGYLQGRGWKVKVNESAESEEDTFEVLEGPPGEDNNPVSDPTMLSEEELLALKGFAQALAKNGKLTAAIQNGTLDTALSTVPAAAELVKNAQAQQKLEKDSLIAVIKANSANTYTDEELGTMSNLMLVKLNAQMNVSYAGLGGGAFIQNAEQPLTIRPVLLAQVEEARDGS